jgi:hypothetical protein
MGYDVDALRLARARPVSGLGSAGVCNCSSPMSGPVPSNLVLLSQLGRCVPGTKVRFLGWYFHWMLNLSSVLICASVDQYIVQAATLRLKHNHPTSAPPVVANVNVEHVLERVKRHELDVGTWINVIGYVEQRKEKGVFVQAVAVWGAGDVDLEAYTRAVERRQETP